MEGEGGRAAVERPSEEGPQPAASNRDGSGVASILKTRTTAISIPYPHTTAVSVPDPHTTVTVPVPSTTLGSFPFSFPTPPNPVTIPFQNLQHPISIPVTWFSTLHPTMTTTQPAAMTTARSTDQPPQTLPPSPPTSQEGTTGELPPPRRSNIRPPSIMPPITEEKPPEPRLNKRRVTITPPFTPQMSVGVRETEWVQLTQLGLGKALDATNAHPWASKSSYQAKEVQVCDLVLTNEGQRLINYVKVIDNYFNVLGNLEGSIRLPHQPIEIGVAADTHRSYCQTQEIRGKTVYTRTIAFNITADTYTQSDPNNEYETLFQHQLKLHLEREHGRMQAEERNGASDTSLCLDFLHSLGGVTHYVSSITLGAMEYSVKKVQALDIGTTVNSRAGFGPMAGALASKTLMVRKTKRKQVQHNEKIGRISDKDRVSPHSHDEAVIHYSITSLANLITDHRLRQNVQTAIQTYITTRLHRINGPYYIITPERVQGELNIYWHVVEERDRGEVTHYIRPTTSREEASTFYIRPDYRKVGKYFFITTFDTLRPIPGTSIGNCQSREASTSILQPTVDDSLFQQPAVNHGDHTGNHGNHHHGNSIIHHHGNASQSQVERYIHVSRKSFFKHFPNSTRITMKAKAAVSPDFARFQLIDRRDRTAKSLLESDWLPDEHELWGQPFFLRQYYHLTKCMGVAGFSGRTASTQTRGEFHFNLSNMSCHHEGRCHMLFQLVRAEKTRVTTDQKN